MLGINSIHWVCKSPSPYNDQLFRSLYESLPIPILFHFTESASSIHSWDRPAIAEFPQRVYHPRCDVDWRLVQLTWSDTQSLFVTNCWQDPTSQIILGLCILANRPYVIWNDTPSFTRKRSLLKRHLRAVFLKAVFQRAMAVMGTGEPAMAALAQMGCPPTKLLNFPYFIDLIQFPFVSRGAIGQPVIFGSCGRLHRDKGYDIALRALAAISRKKSFPFRYRIAGTGPESTALRKLAQDLGISNQLEFAGWIDSEGLPAFYQSIDIFLHPARTEPFGVCIVEAMASGGVVIASDQTAGALDRIRDGVNGFLHRCDDVADLGRAIDEAIQRSPADQHAIRVAARASADAWPTARGVEIINGLLNGRTSVPENSVAA